MRVKRVLVCTDIEGVAGVVSFEQQAHADGKYYEQARLLLTGEVNAAVEGMLEAGVEEVLVADGHGAGGIHFETLHPAAKLIHGRIFSWERACSAVAAECDASIMIGQHAMSGVSDGNLNHTECSRTIEYYKLNGKFIGEIAKWSLFCGAYGLPMIFLSGDEAACREAQELIPGVTVAVVKQGISRLAAISLSAPKSQELIRVGAIRAIQKQDSDPIAPLVWQGPFTLEKRFLFTDCADFFETHPMYERLDAKTVQIKSKNILDIVYS